MTATFARKLSWWLLDYAYAARWQVRALLTSIDPAKYLSGTRAPVLILPGVYETWKFMQPLIEHIHKKGHPVHVITGLRYNAKPVADAALLVSAYLADHNLHGVVVVSHSKGGLIGKYAMTLGPEMNRIEAMLAVAAPFGGSRYARFLILPSLRIFAPAGETIRALTARIEADARIVSVYGTFDPHVPEGSYLPGAKNVKLETGGHFRVIAHPRVLAELAALAERNVVA